MINDTDQIEAFPMTKVETAELFLEVFQEDVETAEKALIKARARLGGAMKMRDIAEENLRQALDSDVLGAALKMKRGAEEAGIGLSFQVNDEEPIVITEAPAVDPITGEVEASAVERYDSICPDCGGDGRLDDRTGGGHHKCKACDGTGKIVMERPATPIVLVAWPDNPDMQTIEVGPLTRYGELAADFLASLPNDDPRRTDAFTDYRIVDVDADSERDPHAIIMPADYGLEFSVEAVAKAEESAA